MTATVTTNQPAQGRAGKGSQDSGNPTIGAGDSSAAAHGGGPAPNGATTTPRPRDRQATRVRYPNGKYKLRTLDQLDLRSRAYLRVKDLVDSIKRDVGCDDEELTASQQQLIQNAALLGVMIENLSVQWLEGEKVEVADFALLVNAQRRVLQQLTG
jgi:hypothetical protein